MSAASAFLGLMGLGSLVAALVLAIFGIWIDIRLLYTGFVLVLFAAICLTAGYSVYIADQAEKRK